MLDNGTQITHVSLTGAGAATDATGTVITLGGSPDLSGVLEGLSEIQLTVGSEEVRGVITSVNNTNKSVTVAEDLGVSLTGLTWSIKDPVLRRADEVAFVMGTDLRGDAGASDGAGTVLTLDGSPDLSGVATNGSYFLYTTDATTGQWLKRSIVGVDDIANEVTLDTGIGVNRTNVRWRLGQLSFNGTGLARVDAFGDPIVNPDGTAAPIFEEVVVDLITNDGEADQIILHGGQDSAYGSFAGDDDQFSLSTNDGRVNIDRATINDNGTPDDRSDDINVDVMRIVLRNAKRDLSDPSINGSTVTFAGDSLRVEGHAGNDDLLAGSVDDNLIAVHLKGDDGFDQIVGSQFDDVIDGGMGDDELTGAKGVDVFLDSGGNDTLVETFDEDISLFGDTFIVGTILGDGGGTFNKFTKVAEQEANELAKTTQAFITIRDTGDDDQAYTVSHTAPNSTPTPGTQVGTQYEVKLEGDVIDGQVWTLTVAGTSYSYTAGSPDPVTNVADPLQMVVVAKRLADQVNAALKDQGDNNNTRYAAEDADPEPIIFGLIDTGDLYDAGAEVESLLDPALLAANPGMPVKAEIFENAIITGGDSNNVLVVGDSNNRVQVEGASEFPVSNWRGTVTLDARGGGEFNEYYIINLKGTGARYFIDDNGAQDFRRGLCRRD